MGIQVTIDNPGQGEWTYAGTQVTAADPGSGQWKTDALDTRIDLSITSLSGMSVDSVLSQFEAGAQLYLRTSGEDRTYTVSTVTNNTTWFELGVSVASSSTSFALTDGSVISIAFRWPKGAGGGGVTDHGALTGLTPDDDHPQYFNQARGDARYNTQAEITALLAPKAESADARFPTADEKAALAGTGTPAVGNPYVNDDDSRLTDDRDPTAHTHTASEVTDFETAHDALPSDNPHGVTAADVGLGNVDNTADLDKPISTATQSALDTKLTETTHDALPSDNPHGVTAADVLLGNVDNTADLDKPISTATQTALDGKLATSHAGGNTHLDWTVTGLEQVHPDRYTAAGNPLSIEDDGFELTAAAQKINFTGAVVVSEPQTDEITVAVTPGSAPVASVFGEVGVITEADANFTAVDIANQPAGNIAAPNVQAAINELDTEKAPVSHSQVYGTIDGVPTQTFLGRDQAGTGATQALGLIAARQLLDVQEGSTASGALGDSYATTHALDDEAHTAAHIVNAPAGDITSPTVQGAINELDTGKSATDHRHTLSDIDDAGTAASLNANNAIGGLPLLGNIGGNPALPQLDGSQLTGIDTGQSIAVQDESDPPLTTALTKLTFTGVGVEATQPGPAGEITVNVTSGAPGVLDITDGTTSVAAVDLLTVNGTAFSIVDQDGNDALLNPNFGVDAGQIAQGDHDHGTLVDIDNTAGNGVILGRDSAGLGQSEELTPPTVAAMLDHADLGTIGTDNPHQTRIGNLLSGTHEELEARLANSGAVYASGINDQFTLGPNALPDIPSPVGTEKVMVETAAGSKGRIDLDNLPTVTLANAPSYLSVSGNVLTHDPIDLESEVSGKLPLADLATGAPGGVIGYAATTGIPTDIGVGSNGEVLISQGAAAPIWGTAPAGTPAASVATSDASAGVVGTDTEYARQDHEHQIVTTGTPGDATPGDTAAAGSLDSLARVDHQHGLPAFGVAPGTFCEGDDGRLSDSRTPTGHFASHQNGSGDEISVAGLSGLLADPQTPLTHAYSLHAGSTIPAGHFDNDTINLTVLETQADSGVIICNGSGVPAYIGPGQFGQVLQSGGTGVIPSWATAGGDVSATGTPLITEYARWVDGTTIEGRTKAQTLEDLDLEIGTDVQAWSAVLDATEASYTTSDQSKVTQAPNISSGAGAPGSTPTAVGDIYTDTTSDVSYIAAGTTSSADWKQATGTAGADLDGLSDVTLTSPATDAILIKTAGNWVDGKINTDSINDDQVTNAKLDTMLGNTVKLNATAGDTNPTDFAVGTNTVLGRVGVNIVAAQLVNAQIADDTIENAKLANMAANTVKVNDTTGSANPTDLAVAASQVIGRGATGDLVAAQLETSQIADDAVTLAKIDAHTGAVAGVLGYGASGAPSEVSASGTTGHVLKSAGTGATPVFGQIITDSITDDHVTYPKIQNVVNNYRVLGRISGDNGVVEELTGANILTISGADAAGTARPADEIEVSGTNVTISDTAPGGAGEALVTTSATAAGWKAIPTLSRSITIEDPGTAEDITMFFTPVAITVTDIRSLTIGASSTVNFDLYESAFATRATTTAINGSSMLADTNGNTDTSFTNAGVAANSWVSLKTTTGGTAGATELHVTVIYTED